MAFFPKLVGYLWELNPGPWRGAGRARGPSVSPRAAAPRGLGQWLVRCMRRGATVSPRGAAPVARSGLARTVVCPTTWRATRVGRVLSRSGLRFLLGSGGRPREASVVVGLQLLLLLLLLLVLLPVWRRVLSC